MLFTAQFCMWLEHPMLITAAAHLIGCGSMHMSAVEQHLGQWRADNPPA
jgi:amino acid permease